MKNRGFTLVEVLASMAVLMILTLALTRMFLSASDITQRGMTSIARNSVGESAMENILSDLDCMVVNERISCCKIADVAEKDFADFDTIYFIGTNGDNDDDMPYEYFHYFVNPVTVTNALGAVYRRFDLVKSRVVMAVGAKWKFYSLLSDDIEWWDAFDKIPLSEQDHEVLAENVVGFDIYCQRWDDGQKDYGYDFYSTDSVKMEDRKNARGQRQIISVSNQPPVAFDIRLKLTSPEAAIEGGMLIAAGGTENVRRGWELLNREGFTLLGRAMPMMGTAQHFLQRRAGKKLGSSSPINPVSHYYFSK